MNFKMRKKCKYNIKVCLNEDESDEKLKKDEKTSRTSLIDSN